MFIRNKWINLATTVLALLSMGEIMFTIFLLLLMSDVLYYTHSQLPTASGLVASLLSLPTVFKIKGFQSCPARKQQEDVINYHRYLLYISLSVQIISVLFCIVSVFRCAGIYRIFLESMIQYQDKINDKIFVDMVQLIFQCCGTNSYNDWIQIRGAQSSNFSNKQIIESLLQENEKSLIFMPNLNDDSTIPYSCCTLRNIETCSRLNTGTINTIGCGNRLTKFIVSLLLTELAIYVFLIITIAYLLQYMKVEELIDESKVTKFNGRSNRNSRNSKVNWDNFTNSNSAEITPTSHTELLLSNEKTL